MARLTDIPFARMRSVIGGAQESRRRGREYVRVAIELEPGVSRWLVDALRVAFIPETASGLVHVATMRPGVAVRVNTDADLALVVTASSAARGATVAHAFCAAGVPCAIVAESILDAPCNTADLEGVVRIVATTRPDLLDKLASWVADVCTSGLAFAVNFPFARRCVAHRCVRVRSAKNAAIGLFPFGSGAELPAMAANQALMALDLAAAYRKGVDVGRLVEGLWVVGGAFAFRALARALVQRVLPVFAVVVRTGVAYGGTTAMGEALIVYFELSVARAPRGVICAPSVENASSPSV